MPGPGIGAAGLILASTLARGTAARTGGSPWPDPWSHRFIPQASQRPHRPRRVRAPLARGHAGGCLPAKTLAAA